MREIGKLLFILLAVACSSPDSPAKQETSVVVNMATVGVANFGHYIRHLSVYAFRREAGGGYVYHKTLATLDSAGIAALENVSDRGNAKFFTTSLEVGNYELYFVGNAAGNTTGEFNEGVTLPSDILLEGKGLGVDRVYFLGRLPLLVVTSSINPAEVMLHRIASKLVVALYGLPQQVASVRLSVGNIAAAYSLAGQPSGDVVTVERVFGNTNSRDTVFYELLTLPTSGTLSPFSITFRSVSGEERTKEMPGLLLLPDKYIRVTGVISDDPGALLSFDIAVNVLIFENWGEEQLPDFPIKPVN